MLLVAVRVADDQVSRDRMAARAGSLQVLHRPNQLPRIDLAAGAALPIISAGFEAEKETSKARLDHQLGQLRSDETGIESIRRVKLNRQAPIDHSLKKWPQDLIRPIQQGIVIKCDVGHAQP